MSESAKVAEYKQAGNRRDAVPAHEMVYFKGLTSAKRAFGDFRTVLHTGLFSQIVAMEVPVGGDIGDEVCLLLARPFPRIRKLEMRGLC
jgi:putative ABC transport system ATP-binding protein